MDEQKYPFDPTAAAHFVNLALAAEAQADWETSDSAHAELENPFAIPLACYEKLFASSDVSAEGVKADVEGPIAEKYEVVGSIRTGSKPVADYEEMGVVPSLTDAQDFDAVVDLITIYRRRVSETITNTVRYNRSNLLMGFALRSKEDGHGVIVLRGTMNVEEWLTNIYFQMTPFQPAKKLEYGEVHHGFRNIYKGLRGRYRELAAEFPADKPLYLVGRSLGAAVTAIGALDIALRRPERAANIQAYLIAPPRTGDPVFAQHYDAHVGTSYRLINLCDVVPTLPFKEINMVADVLSFPYADTKGEVAFVHQTGNPIANHIAAYYVALNEQRGASGTVGESKTVWLA